MYTITFFDGTARHVRDDQALAVMEDKVVGKTQILVDGSLISLSSVARIDPSALWLEEQNEKLRTTEYRVCGYGVRHRRNSPCDCLKQARLPLGPETARNTLETILRASKDGSLSVQGQRLLESGYPKDLVTAFPELRSLLP